MDELRLFDTRYTVYEEIAPGLFRLTSHVLENISYAVEVTEEQVALLKGTGSVRFLPDATPIALLNTV